MNLKESTTKLEREKLRQFLRDNLSIRLESSLESDWYGSKSFGVTANLIMLNDDGKEETICTDQTSQYF